MHHAGTPTDRTGAPGGRAGEAAGERVVAIVPLKALRHAKGRLIPELGASQRRELTGWMLERVVEACRGASGVHEVLVVAGDREAAALALALGVAATVERRPGLTAALAAGDRLAAGSGASLVLTADLPLATPRSVRDVLAAAPAGAGVVVAESVDGGTSALLRRPPQVTATGFGPDSARAHLELAERAGVPAVRLRIPELALDVDDAAALHRAARRSPDLARWLQRRGLGLRAAAS